MAALCGPALATVAEHPDQTWQADGPVFAVARAGDRIYLAGSFHALIDGHGNSVPRTRVAALDASTGAPLPWAPRADGTVRAIQPSADGSMVFLGGEFKHVDGRRRNHLAAVSASTGKVVAGWTPDPAGTVYDIGVYGDTVYIGGGFGSVDGQSRHHLAAIRSGNGGLVGSFAPEPDSTVRAVSVSPDGRTLYFGGDFTHVGSSYRANVAAVSASSGSLLSWSPNPSYPLLDLVASASAIYVAGAGPGGTLAAFQALPGDAQTWTVHTDGNFQAVGFLGTTVYAGGHFDNLTGAVRHKILAVRAGTGALLAWNPGMNSSVGVHSVVGYGTRLYVGGEFTVVDGASRHGFAQFTE